MKILLIGATGTIGAAVAADLSKRHEVVPASRTTSRVQVNLDDPASVRALFATLGPIDAVVSCAGNARFGALDKLTDEDFKVGIDSKFMGQVNVARAAIVHLRDGGSVTLTTGVLAQRPMPGSAAISAVNGALESFVAAAALELPRGIRINAVSPPWVKETLRKLGRDDAPGLSAADVARAYVAAVEGKHQGKVLDPAALG